MDRFEAKLNVLRHRQDQHIFKVQSLLTARSNANMREVRRHHDSLVDPLARRLLDVLNERGEGESRAARQLCLIVDGTFLNLKGSLHDIQDAVNSAWCVLAVIGDAEYIRSFTASGTDEDRFRLVAYALETIKAWLLVTEAAIEQALERGHRWSRMAWELQRRNRHRPITGPDEG